jgi:hypothetical protein
MADDTDFAALYRELGVDPNCTPADLRRAWRRRVAKLHPDLGGDAKDTGRLQQLNRLYDSAVDFHARYGRMPGALPPGQMPVMAADEETPRVAAWRRADIDHNETPAAGFGRIARYFTAVSLLAVIVLTWRVAYRADSPDVEVRLASSAGSGSTESGSTKSNSEGEFPVESAAKAASVAQAIVPGMGKHTVRDILGEPLDMHAMRWSYGPSWVEFRCDEVVGWYSSPLRPLPVSTASTDAPQAVDDRCD